MRNSLAVLLVVALGSMALSFAQWESRTARQPRKELRFHPNGVLAIEQQLDDAGKLHGPLRTWYETGTLFEEYEFVHGVVISSKHYDPEGHLQFARREGRDYQLVRDEE